MPEKPEKIIGSDSQTALYKLYGKYVSKSKAQFFKGMGFGIIQGERHGIYIKTLEGAKKNTPPMELIDCRTSGGVFNFGHNNPEIKKFLIDAVESDLDIGDHHLISEQRALLGKTLADLLPEEISKTQYCVGGGEAIDLALKMARGYTGRTKIISAKNSYHGVTGLALAAGDAKFRDQFQWNLPDFYEVEFGNFNNLKEIADRETAAIILETIPAVGGIVIAPHHYFSQVRQLCDELGIMLIADEVQAGLGRTGKLWGIYGGIYEDELVVPDLIVLGKGMSAGVYPLATVSYKPFLDSVFAEDPFIHISTTGGSEIGCYVTRKMLGLLSKPEFLAHVNEMGKYMEQGLVQMKADYPQFIKIVRGRGLMWGLELPNERYGLGFTLQMINNGVLADYCGNNKKTIKLMPPLIITKEELDEMFRRLRLALDNLPQPKEESK